MRNKKRSDRLCDCIPYGKIEPKKLERLQKNRQRQMCSWRDIAPFSERQEEEVTVCLNNSVNRLLFPPIYELPSITNPEAYRGMCNTGNRELTSNEVHMTSSGRAVEDFKGKPYRHDCSSALKSHRQEEEEDRFANSECSELGNKTDSQSLKLKLPKLTGLNVVNQRLS